MAKAKMHQQINLQNSLVSGNVIEITNFRDEKTYTWNSTNFNKRKKALQTLQVKKVFFFFWSNYHNGKWNQELFWNSF